MGVDSGRLKPGLNGPPGPHEPPSRSKISVGRGPVPYEDLVDVAGGGPFAVVSEAVGVV